MAGASKTGLSRKDYQRFHELILAASGIEMPDSRRADLEKEVLRLLAERGAADTDTLYRLLAHEPGERPSLEALVGSLTIGETHFFRNRPQFDALEQRILPDLIARRRATRRLRVWSAGCATGEEPYSLAILLERLLPDIDDWHISILATDIDRVALEKARRGVYRRWSFREVPTDIGTRWFTERDGVIEVRAAVRDRVTFGFLNLIEDGYPSLHTNTKAMDLILCRNVLMYLTPGIAREVVRRLGESLVEGGWLVVGHTEPSQDVFQAFEAQNLPGTVLYRKPERKRPPENEEKPTRALVRHTHSPTSPSPAPAESIAPTPAGSAALPRAAKTGTVAKAASLLEAGRLEEARVVLEGLVDHDRDDAHAPYLLGRIAADRLDLESAERWLDIAVARSPLHASAHHVRGLLLQEAGRREDALGAFRRCVYADPGFVLGHYALAGLFRLMGRYRRARKSLDNVTRLLAERGREEPIDGGDGMTTGRLLELAAVQRRFIDQDAAR